MLDIVTNETKSPAGPVEYLTVFAARLIDKATKSRMIEIWPNTDFTLLSPKSAN